MKSAVIACFTLCSACMLDRDIGAAAGRLSGGAPPLAPASPIPPPPRTTDPCCAIGSRLAVDPGEANHQALQASAAWDGARWAVVWGDSRYGQHLAGEDISSWRQTAVRFIEGDVPGAFFRLSHLDTQPSTIAHHRSPQKDRRYLVAFNRSRSLRTDEVDHTTRIVAVNDRGVEQAAAVVQHASRGVSLAHSPGLGAWAVGAVDKGADIYGSGGVILLDQDTLRPLREGIPLGQALGWSYGKTVTALALDDRVVTVVAAADGVHVRTFVGRDMDEPHPEVVIAVGNQVDPFLGNAPVHATAATIVRDRVLVAALNRETLRTWTYRPATGTISGPIVIDMTAADTDLALAGDSDGGSAGICYSFGPGRYPEPAALRFALVGPDGELRGTPVELQPAGPKFATCGVAPGARDEYLVTLHTNVDERTPHTLFAQTVRVQRATGPVE